MDGYILIQSTDDFMAMGTGPAARYKLANDLDFSGIPFGNHMIQGEFDGELNGNGFRIKGVELRTAPDQKHAAVFEKLGRNSVIQNLVLEGLRIDMFDTLPESQSTIYASGLVSESNARIIYNVHVQSMFVRFNNERGVFNRVVGIAETAYRGNGLQGGIQRCSVRDVEVECTQWTYVFGIAFDAQVDIRDCYVSGVQRANISGNPPVVLYFQPPGFMKNCYLAAPTGRIDPAADITRVINCYFDNTIGEPGANPFGRSTDEMRQQTTFIGWDFARVWSIDEGNGYPTLKIEEEVVPEYTALTAQEYDDLGLTAAAYDGKNLTANDYDLHGKILLT